MLLSTRIVAKGARIVQSDIPESNDGVTECDAVYSDLVRLVKTQCVLKCGYVLWSQKRRRDLRMDSKDDYFKTAIKSYCKRRQNM